MSGSNSKYHRGFDPEFKREMVKLIEELGKSPVEEAKDVGVTPTSVRRWVRQYGTKEMLPGKVNFIQLMKKFRKRDSESKS